MSAERFYRLMVGAHSVLVAAASVRHVRRVHQATPGLTTTVFGQITLCDLAEWFNVLAPATRIAVIVALPEGWFGISADTLDDSVTLDGPLQPLPALIQELGYDPAISGIGIVAGSPILFVDLERFARTRLFADQPQPALD